MAFATKKDAQNWAKDYLEKADKPGHFIDPIGGGTVELMKRSRYWGFTYNDSWIDDVEVLRESQAADQKKRPQG